MHRNEVIICVSGAMTEIITIYFSQMGFFAFTSLKPLKIFQVKINQND